MNGIEIKGARENNLKNVSLTIPYSKIVSFIGVSGSGKSTLVFDTIYAEGKRRYIESLGVNESFFLSKIKKSDTDYFMGLPPAIALMQSKSIRNPRSTVGTISQMGYYLQVLFSSCGIYKGDKKISITPSMFNLNSPVGACYSCEGTGEILEFDETLIWPDQEKSLSEGGLKLGGATVGTTKYKFLCSFLGQFGCNESTPIKEYSNELKVALLYGQRKTKQYKLEYPGIISDSLKLYRTTKSIDVRENLEHFMVRSRCEDCLGTGYNKDALDVYVDDKNIDYYMNLPLDELYDFLRTCEFNDFRDGVWNQFKNKFMMSLKQCIDLGVGYLTLSRCANTLSGGEAQRLKIVAQISSEISGVLYVLDEPTSGLHASDVSKVLTAIKKLNDVGNKNTVLLVEHTASIIKESDYIFEVGPGAGVLGGKIIAEGTLDDIINNENSITGAYLSGAKTASVVNTRDSFEFNDYIEIKGACAHNLKGVDVKIPLHSLSCVTGVSGSGKTSLVFESFYQSVTSNRNYMLDSIVGREKIKNVILCDQSSIGSSSRSCPLSFLSIYENVRKLLAKTDLAKSKKLKETDFSFNVVGGRCEECKGEGTIQINMGFLPSMDVECEVCHGKRFNDDVLEVTYKGLNIYDILNLSITDAIEVFKDEKLIVSKLKAMEAVGLSYLTLGQPTSTLSGGESQRLKLANEIAKTKQDGSFIIFDEPTKGLHFEDVKRLLSVMKALVKLGNTILIVEHNLDVIASCDYVIDIGPGAGKYGGSVVGCGTPSEIAKLDTPTGRAISSYFDNLKTQ